MTERALQVAVEIVIDISERIIALENCGHVESASECIKKLVVLKILKLEQPFEKMVKLRNIIVHQYEHINPEILFDLTKNCIDNFKKFINAIDNAE